MTSQQKNIIAVLAIFAIFILSALVCAGGYIFFFMSTQDSSGAVESAVAQPSATPVPTATASPTPTFTAVPLPTTLDAPQEATPTSTKVVVVTVLPTPTPTVANCIDFINDFEASGVTNNEEVRNFLAMAVPSNHLDYCRKINYIHIYAASHDGVLAGNIIPGYREINIYSLGEYQTKGLLFDTIVHEVGHNVHYNIRRDIFDLDVQWAELYRESETMFLRGEGGFVSNYARSSKFEDFAESYMTYIRYPDELRLVNIAKYEYMKSNIFNGVEY